MIAGITTTWPTFSPACRPGGRAAFNSEPLLKINPDFAAAREALQRLAGNIADALTEVDSTNRTTDTDLLEFIPIGPICIVSGVPGILKSQALPLSNSTFFESMSPSPAGRTIIAANYHLSRRLPTAQRRFHDAAHSGDVKMSALLAADPSSVTPRRTHMHSALGLRQNGQLKW